ncbi:MAG: hypothetical protein ACOYJH_04920 [Anaerovoracaceae bacterium]|jgi:hypothetical protein
MTEKIIIVLLLIVIAGLIATIFVVRAEMRKLIRGVKISRGWRYSTSTQKTEATLRTPAVTAGSYEEGYKAGVAEGRKTGRQSIDENIVAAIAAAVAVCEGPGRRLVIRNIRRAPGGDTAWQSSARFDSLN